MKRRVMFYINNLRSVLWKSHFEKSIEVRHIRNINVQVTFECSFVLNYKIFHSLIQFVFSLFGAFFNVYVLTGRTPPRSVHRQNLNFLVAHASTLPAWIRKKFQGSKIHIPLQLGMHF